MGITKKKANHQDTKTPRKAKGAKRGKGEMGKRGNGEKGKRGKLQDLQESWKESFISG
jgi:hypothetical protein